MQGWIKIHRDLLNDPIWCAEKFNRAQAWIDLLLRANVNDGHIRINGKRINLKAGDVGWSMEYLANIWKRDRKTVKRWLDEFKEDYRIEYSVDQGSTVITIKNWDYWQNNEWMTARENGTQKGKRGGRQKGHLKHTQLPTNNNDKSDKKIRGGVGHITLEKLKELQNEFRYVDVMKSYEDFTDHHLSRGTEFRDEFRGFRKWLRSDKDKGLHPREIPQEEKTIEQYCPKCKKPQVIPIAKTNQRFCPWCDKRLVDKYELYHSHLRD